MNRPVDEIESTECQFQFSYEEVVPCANKQSLRGNYPVYEMKCIYGECLPYESIVELRADKIHNFLSVAEWDNVVTLLTLPYESLTKEGGFKDLISQIEKYLGTTASCTPLSQIAPIPSLNIDDEFRTWIMDNVDWSIEHAIGYKKGQNNEDLWG